MTYCWPQLSRLKGRAELSAATPTSPGQSRASLVKTGLPRRCQTTTISAAANPIRPAASQNGVMPRSATSMTRKVAPQVSPKVAIISQLFAVICGAVMLSPGYLPDR